MLHSAKLPTPSTSLANYEPEEISSSALSLVSSSLLFWQVGHGLPQGEEHMAHPKPSSMGVNDNELWFSVSTSARREQDQIRDNQQSAYQATAANRHRTDRSVSPGPSPSIRLISSPTHLNKPLPPSPESEKKRRKPVSLRSLVRRRPSDQLDSTHLQPGPSPSPSQRSSSNGNLSPDPHLYLRNRQSSRSMPTSPSEFAQPSYYPPVMARAHSAATDYSDTTQPQLYPTQPPRQAHRGAPNPYRESQHSRGRRSSARSATASSATPDRQRPHTWLSPTEPTEPFHDASEFHLFVEATSGLPDGNLDFSALSPASPPHLQGSIFARGRQSDRIPIPLQHPSAAQPQAVPPSGWQGMAYDYSPSQSGEPPLMSSSALPRPDPHQQRHLSPNSNEINLELERLGLSDDGEPEDELPNYAQSQAEMSAKRRKEATDRARELEARWNSSRG